MTESSRSNGAGTALLGGAAGVALATTVVLGLRLPPTREQGPYARLIAIHPPLAWASYIAFGVCAVASALWLWRRTRAAKWDRLAVASAELGVVFCALTLVTGSIWGRPTWGVWWTWDARLTSTALLLAMFIGHVVLVAILSYRNRAARPQRYAKTAHVQANPASLMMKWGGVTILAFLVFHLAHFTWGISPDIKFGRGDPYGNVTQAFYHRPWMGAIYLVAMVALAGHLYHGIYSTAQTLGINRQRFEHWVRRTATAVAAVIVAGNVLIILGATFIESPGY